MTLTENILDESRYLINLDHFKLFIKSPKYVINIWFMIDEWSGKESLSFVELKDPSYFQRPLLFIGPKIFMNTTLHFIRELKLPLFYGNSPPPYLKL